MNIFKKIIEFLKKIGVLKTGAQKYGYKSSKDKDYPVPDAFDNN